MTSHLDPAVVLLAHGSPDPRHAEGVDALASRVRRLAPRRPVHPAYLDHHPPTPADAAREAGSGIVVPVLLTPAYHARVDVPEAVKGMGDNAFRAAAPMGPHPLLLDAAEELLLRAGTRPAVDTAVVLYAAGSSDSGAVGSVVETLQAHPRGGWGPWAVAALDGGLSLGEVLPGLRLGGQRVVAVSFMVAEGVLRDRMVSACEAAGIEMVPGALGDTDSAARLVLKRADSLAR